MRLRSNRCAIVRFIPVMKVSVRFAIENSKAKRRRMAAFWNRIYKETATNCMPLMSPPRPILRITFYDRIQLEFYGYSANLIDICMCEIDMMAGFMNKYILWRETICWMYRKWKFCQRFIINSKIKHHLWMWHH